MLHRTKWWNLPGLTLVALGAAVTLSVQAAGQRYALLVGIGDYQDQKPPSLKLEGPVNDLIAMEKALKNWGFNNINVLKNQQATRDEILKALDELVQRAEKGSHVLFYFSGHGVSAHDPQSGASLALPHTTGALVPYDGKREGKPEALRRTLIVGRDDLRPRFKQLDDKGVYLTAWIDACYSENSTHSLGGLPSRAGPGFNPGSFGSGSKGYESYPYKNAVTFAASAANQTAVDVGKRWLEQYPTASGQTHGAFTDALLRGLNNRSMPDYGVLDKNNDSMVTVDEFFAGITGFMATRKYGHDPKLQPLPMDDTKSARSLPLFFADQQPQPAPPLPVAAPAKPAPEATVPSTLPEPQRRQQVLDRLVSAAQLSGRATVALEIQHPYVSSRLPIGDDAHCVKLDLAFKADQKGYPLVIDRFSDGSVQWLYPLADPNSRANKNQWQQAVPAGQAQKLWAAATTPPPGVDTVYTFLLDAPLPKDKITDTYKIPHEDGARFDLLLEELAKPGRILGAHRLPVEIYQPQEGELRSWPQQTCDENTL